MAQSIDGNHLLVGECKWSDVEKPNALINQTRKKGETLPMANNKTIIPIVFARSNPGNKPTSNIFLPGDVLDRLLGA